MQCRWRAGGIPAGARRELSRAYFCRNSSLTCLAGSICPTNSTPAGIMPGRSTSPIHGSPTSCRGCWKAERYQPETLWAAGLLRAVFTDTAETFVGEQENLHRFVVREALAFGP